VTHRLKKIDAKAADRLMKDGALMVDVREPGEYARVRIPGSHNAALSRIGVSDLPLGPEQAVVFFCASGNRTTVYESQLVAKAGAAEAYVVQGGIAAWSGAGLPVESGRAEGDPEPRSLFGRMSGR
jgi:rhodanese-related sulfurtransferase